MAWGKPWPHQSEGEINRTEIVGTKTKNSKTNTGSLSDKTGLDNDEVVSALADIVDVPSCFKYRCFRQIHDLQAALGVKPLGDVVLVVRKEYNQLRKILEESPGHAVVTGHPGVGPYQRWF